MARRTGYSRSYLGNVETGTRQATPGVVRAYERVLGEDVNRRELLIGAVSTVVAASVPDVAVDIAADVGAERSRLLATVQTSHAVDRTIAALVSKDTPSLAALAKWARQGSPILRVNAVGILAKVGSPVLDDDVVRVLKADEDVRLLYLTAVVSRVLGMPWNDARRVATSGQPLAEEAHLQAFAQEVTNPADSGARWCSVVMLARTRAEAAREVADALARALPQETSRENLRVIGGALAGLDPLTV
ncbi:helix-turn-helix domain-containing protein [Planosporangium sp. 12N6]|uniref:helix-turn-helix domain-containing protein n=1 Tax=Planosporangium spinosum TaxID=3402278 RepID=UPI003CEBC369